ncbi:homoserine dehydrogenase [Streptococcus pneumoniae GA44500]|nr:homoserine dehydrogenase [Streptococcus pneumoniae GA44500]
MTVKIALLGFGTVASGVPFLLKENGGKSINQHIQISKLLRYWSRMKMKKIACLQQGMTLTL